MCKMRADLAAVAQGLAPSRARAKELIESGSLLCNGIAVKKPAQEIQDTDVLTAACMALQYVGRGGLKMERALTAFPISLTGKTCLDIGASTGGFTDCMLQNGASKVFAVDVGHDQLAESLRVDPRVISMEGTDIRTLTAADLGGCVDFFSVDVSFISLRLVLPSAYGLLCDGGEAVVLVKPQFEAGRAALGKHGVVRDAKVHRSVLREISAAAEEIGFSLCGAVPSGILGGSGNAEYLFYLKKCGMQGVPIDFTALSQAALAQR